MMKFKNYIFHRMHEGRPMFYPTEYPDDEAAVKGADINPGTTSIEDAHGKVIWRAVAVKIPRN